MVRVLQVVLSLNPGGTERLVVELARRLNPEFPMAVCCLDEPGAWASELTERGIAVTALGRQPGFHWSLGPRLAEIARTHNAAVIHAHHYSPFVYSCLARLRHRGAGVIFTEHGRLTDRGPSAKRRLANRLLARCPARTVTVSADLRQHLADEGFPAASVEVIYNGIDIGPEPDPQARSDVRRSLGAADDELVVGTVARLDPVKDLGTLIEAVAQLAARRPVRAMVVGDGPLRPDLEALAHRLGVGHKVTFPGHRQDARRWLAGCDVFVNSSVSEGVSLTILEAMAARLPVVATRVGGTPEVIDDTCGRLVPARDASALAAAIDQLGGSPADRAVLGTAGRRRVEDRFTLDRMVADYAALYRQVAGQPGGRR